MKKIIFSITALTCCTALISTFILHNKKEEMYIESLIPIMNQEQLILDSSLIIEGTVSEILDSEWSNENFEKGNEIPNFLQTDIVVNVDEIIYGECGDSVTVRIYKGETNDTIVYNDAYPDFFKNEKVLLFLGRDNGIMNTGEDYYMLTGMHQGKYVIENNSEKQTNDLSIYESYKTIDSKEKNEFNIPNLKEQIISLHEANPNYEEEKAIRQAEIIEENKKLFGE